MPNTLKVTNIDFFTFSDNILFEILYRNSTLRKGLWATVTRRMIFIFMKQQCKLILKALLMQWAFRISVSLDMYVVLTVQCLSHRPYTVWHVLIHISVCWVAIHPHFLYPSITFFRAAKEKQKAKDALKKQQKVNILIQ